MREEGYYSILTEPVSMQMSRTPRKPLPALSEAVSSAYNDAKEFISSLDKSIIKCKKYNEDRSYKKYETYIRDLQKTNKELKGTIMVLQQTISPTKQYMMDLLDKMVQLKHEKDSLNNHILELRDQVRLKDAELEQYKLDINRFQKVIRSNKVDKLPLIEENLSHLESTLRTYLKQKEKMRAKTYLPPSNVEEFIIENRNKLWGWNLSYFLQQLQKHLDTVEKPKQTQDLWRAQFRASKQLGKLIGAKKTRTFSTKHSLMSINKTVKKSLHNTSAISES